MAFQTLPYPHKARPAPGSSNEFNFRTLQAQFGDGFVQRTGDGINTMERKCTVLFQSVTDKERIELIDFLYRHGGYKAFLFQFPGDQGITLWVCGRFNDVKQAYNVWDMTLEMQMVFV